ncbi:glycosyltransferase family protein [Pseudonocardia phyllosphaerae]|uniref:glucosyl-3-phosphoglycerate synthase n=1 Tax=Pseudonocardia phyllosphaerae TaxID=3390502 RepID=UPI00397ACB08
MNRPRVAVVLPALDEETTVGSLVRGLLPLTRGRDPLVHDVVVLDSGSTDRTAVRAAEAGARVLSREDAVPDVPVLPGKGEALWRAVVALGADPEPPDVVCFLDADLVDPHPDLVPRLVGPLLGDGEQSRGAAGEQSRGAAGEQSRGGGEQSRGLVAPQLVKGYHRRPLGGDDGHEGGRVTELLARPLLAALRPELGGVRQPLGGEFAATRTLLDRLRFATGYGVDIGLLLDAAALAGPGAIAQVDVGVRRHRNRPLRELAQTSREVLATALDRCGVPDSGAGLTAFLPADAGAATDDPGEGAGTGTHWTSATYPLLQVDRPPPGEVRDTAPACPQRTARRAG